MQLNQSSSILPTKIKNINDMVNQLSIDSPFSNRSNDPIRYKQVLETLLKDDTIRRHNLWYENLGKELYAISDVIHFCITHSAQQFNFWYGNNKYKPFSGSTIVTTLLHYGPTELKKEIKNSCLGFIPERLRYLDECNHFRNRLDNYNDLNHFIESMLELESFNQDPFFKKGLLAIMEIRRILDNFHSKDNMAFKEADAFFDKKIISQFPIPADYRIPEWLGTNKLLNDWMFQNKEFHSNSIYETFLRASTIMEVNNLAKHCEYAPYQLDGFIFTNKSLTNDFHMCMTTAY